MTAATLRRTTGISATVWRFAAMGVEPQEAALGEPAGARVPALHADVVHRLAAMHRRVRVGLRDVQRRVAAHESGGFGPQVAQPVPRRHRVALKPEAGSVDRHDLVVGRVARELVLAHREEREMVVDQPAQETGGLGELVHSAVASAVMVLDLVRQRRAHVPSSPASRRRLGGPRRGCGGGFAGARWRRRSSAADRSRCARTTRGATGENDRISPVSSRSTGMIGWTSRWMPRSAASSCIVSESMMNGMSSTTQSTTECVLCQPSSSIVGV